MSPFRPSLSNVPTKADLIATNRYSFPQNERTCRKIQWGYHYADQTGKLICPDCGGPAEPILGFFGNPCFAHIPLP